MNFSDCIALRLFTCTVPQIALALFPCASCFLFVVAGWDWMTATRRLGLGFLHIRDEVVVFAIIFSSLFDDRLS